MSELTRTATILSWTSGYKQQRYVQHLASDRKTLCGIELGGMIPDPLNFKLTDAVSCRRGGCSRQIERTK